MTAQDVRFSEPGEDVESWIVEPETGTIQVQTLEGDALPRCISYKFKDTVKVNIPIFCRNTGWISR